MFKRIKNLRVFLNDSDKKNMFKIIKEVIQFTFVKKAIPTDYFRKYLYRNDVFNIKNYLSYKEYNGILLSNKIVFHEVSALLENKLCFHLICEKHGINTPQLISYNFKNMFYYNNRPIILQNLNQLSTFFENVFTTEKINILFLKPVDGIGGKGCFLLYKDNLKKQLLEREQQLLNTSFLHEEYIVQHANINTIHANSINTLRIVTSIDNKHEIQVVSVLMRFGVGKSITDNTHTGGFYISVDITTGKLTGIGRQDIVMGGNVFIEHPDSKQVLEGFKVPFFKEACDLVLEANPYFPSKIIGWDVAIATTGPVIIEANHNPSLHMSDVAYGGYCKHPIIKEILKDIS